MGDTPSAGPLTFAHLVFLMLCRVYFWTTFWLWANWVICFSCKCTEEKVLSQLTVSQIKSHCIVLLHFCHMPNDFVIPVALPCVTYDNMLNFCYWTVRPCSVTWKYNSVTRIESVFKIFHETSAMSLKSDNFAVTVVLVLLIVFLNPWHNFLFKLRFF